MTKRLTLVGFAAVAALWGPFVYAELARRPVKPPTEEAEPVAVQPVHHVIEATPVAYEPPSLPAHAEPPAHTSVGTSIDPDRAPAPADEEPEEPAVAEQEPAEPFELAPPPMAPPEPEEEHAAAPAAPAAAAPPANEQPAAAAAIQARAAALEAFAAAQEPAAAEPDNTAAPAEPAQEAAEKAAAPEISAHAKAVKDGKVNVIPETIAPAFRSAFDKEQRDVMWASREETRITSALSNAGVPSNAIAEVRCQSTVCRVSINQASIEAAAQAGLYDRVQQQFGSGVALDPVAQDHRAAFYVMRKAR